MAKKIKITEQQLKMLTFVIKESSHKTIVKKISDMLTANYQPTSAIFREGGEYFDKGMIMNKTDEQLISPNDLLEYLRLKFALKDNKNVTEALQTVIRDWYNGKIDHSYNLSKNVSFY